MFEYKNRVLQLYIIKVKKKNRSNLIFFLYTFMACDVKGIMCINISTFVCISHFITDFFSILRYL